jgi:hypothetical protein
VYTKAALAEAAAAEKKGKTAANGTAKSYVTDPKAIEEAFL